MKKIVFLFGVLAVTTGFIKAQIVNIPDPNFKAYLVGNPYINTNNDTEIQVSEAEAYTGEIYCVNKNISSLIGIEAFVNITGLYCYFNNLTSLDVSHNTQLVELECGENNLTTLDVTQNKELTLLTCDGNMLTSLNIQNGSNDKMHTMFAHNNPNLNCIQVDNVANANSYTDWQKDAMANYSENCNPIAPIVNIPDSNFKAYLVGNPLINTNGDNEIQVSEAVAFTGQIDCSSRNISSLTGIEAFVNLTQLRCHVNNLTVLDVSKNTLLTEFACNNNQLTTLDLSKNTALTKIWCFNNPQLNSLNLKNGNNASIITMQSPYNPSLNCIQVDNVANANSYVGWWKDDFATYSEDCSPILSATDINKKEIRMYPNPVKETLNFSEEVSNLKITDLSGRVIKQVSTAAKSINLSYLAKGIYIISATAKSGETVSRKIVKE